MHNKKLLHKVVREDNKYFHVLVVPQALTRYVLHQAHNEFGHNGTTRTY